MAKGGKFTYDYPPSTLSPIWGSVNIKISLQLWSWVLDRCNRDEGYIYCIFG